MATTSGGAFERRLFLLAQITEKFLTFEPFPTEEVEKKLNQLESTILEIPPGQLIDLKNDYYERIAKFRDAYYRALSPGCEEHEAQIIDNLVPEWKNGGIQNPEKEQKNSMLNSWIYTSNNEPKHIFDDELKNLTPEITNNGDDNCYFSQVDDDNFSSISKQFEQNLLKQQQQNNGIVQQQQYPSLMDPDEDGINFDEIRRQNMLKMRFQRVQNHISLRPPNSFLTPPPSSSPSRVQSRPFLSSLSAGGNSHETYRNFFRSKFEQITPFGDEDMSALKELIIVLAKTIKLLSIRYLTDNYEELQSEAFGHAIEKVPENIRWKYLKIHRDNQKQPRTLKTLLSFLQQRVIDDNKSAHQEYLKSTNGLDQSPLTATASPATSSPWKNKKLAKDLQICNYCKQAGHVIAECPILKSLLCFNCFKMGHQMKKCTNEPYLGVTYGK